MEDWIDDLPTNEYGIRALTISAARQIVARDASGWYVAPFSVGWTVGKAALRAARDRYFHVVRDDGEPLFFDTTDAALAFLRTELKIARAPIVNCVGL